MGRASACRVGGGVIVEAQRAGERFEHLLGGVLVTALLQAYVVIGADPGQHRELLATQPGGAALTEVR